MKYLSILLALLLFVACEPANNDTQQPNTPEVNEEENNGENEGDNGGENEGLVKVKELTDKLNAIIDDINLLKNVFKTGWTPMIYDGGASLKAAASGWYGKDLATISKEDIENPEIKH